MSASTASIQPRQRFSYGVGSIGTGIFTTVPSVLLLFFLITEIQIDPALAGAIILIPKALGIVGDPLIGLWADRRQRKAPGARKAMMVCGAVLGSIGLWVLFALPQHYRGDPLVPALVFFACTTGYSLFAVPYSALPAELDNREEGRRALVSTRMTFAFLGVLVGGVSAPFIVEHTDYATMGAAMGAVCLTSMGLFLLLCRLPRREQAAAGAAAESPVLNPKIISRAFAIQMLSFILLLAAIGAISSLLPFVVRDMGAAADVVGMAMLVYILTALAAAIICPMLIRRLGLRAVWIIAAAAACAAGAIAGKALEPDLFFYAGMALGGAGLAFMQVAGFTALADLTADQLAGGGESGVITGLWMAGEKAGLASGPLLAGFGLKFLGDTALGSASQSAIALIPFSLTILAVAVIAGGAGRPAQTR